MSTNRKMLQSREGVTSTNTDGVLNNYAGITNDKNFIDTLNESLGNDEEVMFVGKKVNPTAKKPVPV